MALISGTKTYQTAVTVVAASSGDGDTIVLKFNGLVIAPVSATAAVAANASGTVTIYWPATGILMGNALVLDKVVNIIAADTTLTSPITATVASRVSMTN